MQLLGLRDRSDALSHFASCLSEPVLSLILKGPLFVGEVARGGENACGFVNLLLSCRCICEAQEVVDGGRASPGTVRVPSLGLNLSSHLTAAP